MYCRYRIREIAVAAVAAACVLVSAVSCHTINFYEKDDLARESSKGWVVFLDNAPSLSLSISRVGDSGTGRYVRTAAGTDYPYAFACPPGEQVFVVAHGDRYVERVTVPVHEDLVTCVGIRMQSIHTEADWTFANRLKITYQLHVTVGSHRFPIDVWEADPSDCVAALGDNDWATRWIAMWALGLIRPPIGDALRTRLVAIAREDPSWSVRRVAIRTLQRLREPLPSEALWVESLEEDVSHWPVFYGTSYSTYLRHDGYVVDSGDEQKWVQLPSRAPFRGLLEGRQDLDVVVECAWLAGTNTSSYFGLTLYTDTSTYNAFCVSKNGRAAIFSFVEDRLSGNPVARTNAAADTLGARRWVRIEVAKRGPRYTMNVNGVEIGAFTDTGAGTLDDIGFFVEGKQAVVFRKVVGIAPERR